jgi:hypothetical protein
MTTEWGFSQSYGDSSLDGTITNYGQPLMDFIEGLGISNSAWVASYDWGPPMFWGDWTLRVGEGEMGGFVKDTLYAKRNDNPPCDTTQSEIEVSPLSYNFGEVELGQPRTFTVSISNKGCGPLTLSGVGLKTDFAITSFPSSSAVIQPNEDVNLEITYIPTILGNNSAILQINSNDADKPVVEVQLNATGILRPLTPSEQIANILTFFDESVKQGKLQGTSDKHEKCKLNVDYQLRTMRDMIQAATSSIEHKRYQQLACWQLKCIYSYCDGQAKPNDLVTGEAVPELAGMIQQLMQTLGCK